MRFLIKILTLGLVLSAGLNAQEFGFFKFKSNVDSLYLVVNKDYQGVRKIANNDSIKLPSGIHGIEVSTPFSRPAETRQEIITNTTRVLTINFEDQQITRERIHNNVASADYYESNFMIITDEESEIYSNNEYKGTGFAKFLNINSSNQIEIRNPNYRTKKVTLIKNSGINLFEHYSRPSFNKSKALSPLPGASQFYKGEYIKSSFLAAGTILSVYGIYKSSFKHESASDDLPFLKSRYIGSSTPEEALINGNLVEDKIDEINRYRNHQIFFASAAILIYGYNILDAIFHTPRGGYRQEPRPLKFYLSSELSDFGILNQAGLRVSLN